MGAGLVVRHIKYYKGEGGGFPQVRAVVNLMSPCLPVARSCTKSNTPPDSCMDSTMNPKVKTAEGEGVGVRSLAHSTLGVEGRDGALG